jgi:hypothetical protein
MKRNVILLLSIAVAAVLVHAWVARMPAPSAPLLSAATAGRSQPGEQLGSRLARRTAGPLARPLAEPSVIAAVETGASSQDRDRQIALQIESALLSGDANRLETAFAGLLPELLRTEPGRLVEMVSRQPVGDSRGALRDELARQWITWDPAAAVVWLRSLGEERAASAEVAVRALAAVSPAQAIDVADSLDVGRDDGSVEHILQIWAMENPGEARRWLANQPESSRTAQLRARLTP